MNEIFFELIRVAIGTQKTLSRQPLKAEWQELYAMSKKQSLVGIVFAALQTLSNSPIKGEDTGASPISFPEGEGDKKKEASEPIEVLTRYWNMPERLYLKWMGMAAKIQQRNEVMNGYTAKTLEYFRTNSFPCQVLKGQGIAKLYGKLADLRQSGDIDVWVNSSRKVLYEFSRKKLGKITGVTYHHIHYEMYQDVEVEAHTWPSFFTNPFHNKRFQKFCMQNAPKYGCCDYASLAFNRVFILQHCFSHFCGHGVGFRQLLDYYFVLKQGFSEEERLESMTWIYKLGMSRFAAALMWLCMEVFGMDKSLCICEPNEKDGRFLLAEVMMTGNMGHQDERVDHQKLQSALGRYLHNIKRDWQIMRIAPGYALWEPLWGIYQYSWVKITNLKYNR